MIRKCISELFGTFALVFCGTGAIVINGESGGAVTHVGIAITFGLIVMVMIYTLGDISGAHMNPAVTLAFALSGQLRPGLVLPYVASQLGGALAASTVLRYLFPGSEGLGGTLPSGTAGQSFVLEALLTLFLMMVISSVASGAKERGLFAGLAIGAAVLLEAMFAGPVSGASMNPARSIGPALLSGHTEHLWVYIAGPVLGAAAAVPLWKYLHQKNDQHENRSVQ